MGHRRLASVRDRPALDAGDSTVTVKWRDDLAAVEVMLNGVDAAHAGGAIAALAATLRHVHADIEYAVAFVDSDDPVAIDCFLRVGFEPELTGPGEEAAWKALLNQDSRCRRLL